MSKTVLRRIIILIPQMIILSLALFFLASLMPGDAISGLLGHYASPEEVQAMRDLHGDGGTWIERYAHWLSGIVRGDFGRSVLHNRPVMDLLGERIFNTVRLSFLGLVLSLSIAFPLGIISARYAGKLPDKSILLYCFAAQAMPIVALCIIAIWVFALNLGWFPRGGSVDVLIPPTETVRIFFSRLHHLMLPALVSAILNNLFTIYTLRAQILDNSSSAYVTTARSKGVPTNVIYRKHIMRNSLLPFAQGFPMMFIGLITGSVFVEQLFAYPGMGNLLVTSLNGRDFTVVNAIVIINGFLIVLGILAGDIILSLVDPRIKVK